MKFKRKTERVRSAIDEERLSLDEMRRSPLLIQKVQQEVLEVTGKYVSVDELLRVLEHEMQSIPHPNPSTIARIFSPLRAVEIDLTLLMLRIKHTLPPRGAPVEAPPSHAENLLCLFLPRAEREEVVGAMEACFRRDLAKYGFRKARRYYWAETLRELFPMTNRFIQMLLRGGFLSWLGHIIHRLISG